MTRYSFANLDAWARKVQKRTDAIVKTSAQEVVSIAQTPRAKGGRMPVDTGFLRNSLQSSLQGSTGLTGPDSYVMIAASMEAGSRARFGWTAEYAAAVNNGARGRAGAHFVEGAADQWPQIVAKAVARAKALNP